MFWKYNSMEKLRLLEDRNLRRLESEEFRDRATMAPSYTLKQSMLMLLKGIVFAISLTAFEYVLKNPDISGYLKIAVQMGFWVSLAGMFYFPYGLYNLIKGLGVKGL